MAPSRPVLSESDLSPSRLRWRRFRRHRRGFASLVILGALYLASFFAGWICCDPNAPLDAAEFERWRVAEVTVRPVSRVQRVQLAPDGRVLWTEGHPFVASGTVLAPDALPASVAEGIRRRLANLASPAVEAPVALADGAGAVARLAPFAARSAAPSSVRLLLRDPVELPVETFRTTSADQPPPKALAAAPGASPNGRAELGLVASTLAAVRTGPVPDFEIPWHDGTAVVSARCDPVSWPFRPVPGHWLGTDMAGRDVASRLLHGLRISLSFGLLLVAASLLFGILAGAVQGYFAGWTDLAGQRLTEIWSAVPFLYVMILLGNALGRSFGLLLLCYALFNWVGIAAYVRAEFLKLRVRPFIDAARTQRLGHFRIMMRHILPNALTPVITLVPFELVGAIGSLAALDYLGFGLPDGTPSWGDLLHQAQQVHRQAWWLILYPSLALFTVMLLGVFVGEGLRTAYDPREASRLE